MRRLNGVAHDLGHHAVSGTSALVPHLFRVSNEAGSVEVTVMIFPPQYPDGLAADESLEVALRSLHSFLLQLVRKQHLESTDIQSASL
jgi:hypothetical protein